MAGNVGRRNALALLAAAALFALAHSQAPLYYSNQHQYMLHGMARAGHGHLDEDWLANTADPTPLFSLLVAVTHHVHDWLFQAYFFVALSVYFIALFAIFRRLSGQELLSTAGLMFAALVTAAHTGLPRLASAHWLGRDYPWFLQTGVANQYVLGPGLQPSVAGVMLLVAIALFLSRKPWLAAVCSSLAAVMHATYLPTAAFLTIAFMIAEWRRGLPPRALRIGLLALVIVLPVLVYDLIQFAPTSASNFEEAQAIIAHDRIPHHAQVSRWFDWIAALQLAWMVLAIVLARRSTLFVLMAVPFALAIALSLVQFITGSDTLALLFPWRTSAVLVPLATAVNLTKFSTWLAPLVQRSLAPRIAARCTSLLGIIALAIGGLWISLGDVAYRTTPEELPLLDYVRDHKQPGETYLLPVEIPKHGAAGKGVFSTSFTRAPQRGKQQGLISVDLQRFRLYTGAPIFVDFKSIPYGDVEILEWWERMKTCQWLYEQSNWDATDVRETLTKYRITHVVAPATRPIKMTGIREVFPGELLPGELYRVYRLP